MHKAAAALLAVPILGAVYVGALVRRSVVSRIGLAIGLTAVLGVAIVGAGLPATTSATSPTPIVPLTRAAFRTVVATNRDLSSPVAIEFTTPMDPDSVAAAINVDPPAPIQLAWNAAHDTLMIAPQAHWSPGVYYTVSVQAGALARTGQPLAQPARAAFLTRQATSGSVAATDHIGTRVSVNAAFSLTFAGPVDPASVAAAIRLVPPVPGRLEATTATNGLTSYRYQPTQPLLAGTTYRLTVAGVVDRDGLALAPVSMAVRTVNPPGVIRFRPQADARNTARDAAISVRFTEPMDHRSTASAFSVKIGGKAIKGTTSWAESGKVLVFKPSATLPFDAAIVAKVGITARSATGAPMTRSVRAIFRTVPKPAAPRAVKVAATAPAKVTPANTSTAKGASAVGGGSWAAAETYYLQLMNCTRTGGWVTPSGSCSNPGGRSVAPLWIDSGISASVTRPYARLLATGGNCSHFLDGNPGNRLARAGYHSYRWAENIGCYPGGPNASVLGAHLFFQSEKPYSGGHYVNLMNPAYDRVGIGVWMSNGRVRLVIDFYHS